MSKGFRKNLLENAKKVKTISKSPGSELTAGEQYILERKQRVADDGLTLGERLLQERLEISETFQLPVIEESVISEDVKETAEMISEVSEAILEVPKEEVEPLTEESRILEYIDTIKNNESKKSIVEQDLQNSAASMADLASLRGLVRNLQTSLTSLGGGGMGEQDVLSLIRKHEGDGISSAVGATVAGGRFQFNNNFTDNSTYVKGKFGISNITRNSSGNYTVQFDAAVSTALVNENSYIATATVDYAGDTPTSATFVAAVNGQTSNSFNILIEGLEGHDADHNGNSYINFTVVRVY